MLMRGSIPEPKKLTKLLTIKPIQTMEQNEDQELELHDYEVRDGEIIIPEGTTYLQCEDFWGRTDFTRIVIPDSVTTMDEYQFDGCTNLKSVVLSNSVDTIRTLTFRDCTSLESITIPPSVKRIDDFAFVGCTNLKRFFLPKTVVFHIERVAIGQSHMVNRKKRVRCILAIPLRTLFCTEIGECTHWHREETCVDT